MSPPGIFSSNNDIYTFFKLCISLFEENIPGGDIDEATACAGDGAGQFLQPIGTVISKKTIYMTEEQFNGLMNELDEATTTMNAGNYQYDVPFPVDSDDPTMKHNKGKKRGTAANAIGMDRLTESEGSIVDVGKELQMFLNDRKYQLWSKMGESSSPTKRDYMIAKYFYELGVKNGREL